MVEEVEWRTLVQNNEVYRRYKVSNTGRVWDNRNGCEVSQVLTGKPQYLYVNLTRNNGKRTLKRVHNCVAWTFLGEPPRELSGKYFTCDHIDQDKFNNNLSNLRWASRKKQSNNRGNTIICSDGELLSYKIDKYCKESGEDYKSVYSSLCSLYRNYQDFDTVIKARRYFLKYGDEYIYKVKVDSGNEYFLCELCEMFNLDFSTTKQLCTSRLSFEEVCRGYINSLPAGQDNSKKDIEVDGWWFPSVQSLVKHYHVKEHTYRQRIKDGMTPLEALTYDCHQDSLTRWCRENNISVDRAERLLKQGYTKEQILTTTPTRVIKHWINGEIKRNSEWATYFGLLPKSFNSRLSKEGKNIRKTLEYYGVDTTNMEIYPCDGEFPMYNNPV